MLILVNVDVPHFSDGWHECEGFKLEERDNGTFNLVVTRDLERAQDAERRVAALNEG